MLVWRSKTHDYMLLFCPGCKTVHAFNSTWNPQGPDEKLTLMPSVKVTRKHEPAYCCHFMVQNGQVQFLTDSTHWLVGKTVPMEEIPEELVPKCEG
jgi:hypothetical protein